MDTPNVNPGDKFAAKRVTCKSLGGPYGDEPGHAWIVLHNDKRVDTLLERYMSKGNAETVAKGHVKNYRVKVRDITKARKERHAVNVKALEWIEGTYPADWEQVLRGVAGEFSGMEMASIIGRHRDNVTKALQEIIDAAVVVLDELAAKSVDVSPSEGFACSATAHTLANINL